MKVAGLAPVPACANLQRRKPREVCEVARQTLRGLLVSCRLQGQQVFYLFFEEGL